MSLFTELMNNEISYVDFFQAALGDNGFPLLNTAGTSVDGDVKDLSIRSGLLQSAESSLSVEAQGSPRSPNHMPEHDPQIR